VKRLLLPAVAILALRAVPAQAGSATSTVTVTANVISNCTISAGTVAFGNYDPTSATALDQTGTVNVQCTTGTVATIAMGQGSNAATGSTDAAPLRQMASVAQRLRYDLYQDSGRTTVWGNTLLTSVTYAALSSASTAMTIYGRIPINQNATAGAGYSDSVTATINF
jgi:spore coat protein U-like protein